MVVSKQQMRRFIFVWRGRGTPSPSARKIPASSDGKSAPSGGSGVPYCGAASGTMSGAIRRRTGQDILCFRRSQIRTRVFSAFSRRAGSKEVGDMISPGSVVRLRCVEPAGPICKRGRSANGQRAVSVRAHQQLLPAKSRPRRIYDAGRGGLINPPRHGGAPMTGRHHERAK